MTQRQFPNCFKTKGEDPMKKKLFALLMAVVMVLSLAACGKKAETPTEDPGAAT